MKPLKIISEKIVKYFDKFVYFIVLMAALFSTSLIFFPHCFSFIDPRDRVGLAQLSFEIAGVLALLLAAWEFRKGQRKPKLDLGISKIRPNHPDFFPTRVVSDTTPGRTSQTVNFHIILENYGDTIARWVKVNLELENIHPNIDYRFYLESNNDQNYWTPQGPSLIHDFDGRESYVIYSRHLEKRGYGECEILGTFVLHLHSDDGKPISFGDYPIKYSIKSDGIDEVTGSLFFKLLKE